MPTQAELETAYNEASARTTERSRYPGMSYEEGVRDALAWASGESDENPLESE